MTVCLHIEDPELLRRAIEFTARETGFSLRLVEKDYYCSVVLDYLAASDAELTFKGGTCLSKIHGAFYRLSEDLDFTVPTPTNSTRRSRSASAGLLKEAIDALPQRLPGLRIIEPLRGMNESTQYNAKAGYESLVDGHVEPVSIEVGVREPTMLETIEGAGMTLLLDPVTGTPMLHPFPVTTLSYYEAMAEKVRAALCRDEVAIRDYFDVEHAMRSRLFDPFQPEFLDLLRRKISIPRTGPVDVSRDRMRKLREQLDPELRPVLRDADFAQFNFDLAAEILRRIAAELP